MTRKKKIKITLILEFFLLALGGWLLHYRIHSPVKEAVYLIPFFTGIIGVFCIPILFYFRKTLLYAYLINGFIAIIGTILMAQFSVEHFQGPLTPLNIIINTLFADIALLWARFSVGKALFELEFLKMDADVVVKGRFFRFPNMGWWWAHLLGFTAVYVLGKIILK